MDRTPKLSIILFDWSVRESYHAVEYLNRQTGIERSAYEVIWIEYYGRRSPELDQALAQGRLDKYLVLDRQGLYRKHALINEGILQASGDIVVNCDSDAIFSPTFAASILKSFEENQDIILYLDEVRNRNKKFYPFAYPDWEDVLSAPGVMNWDADLRMTPGVALDDAALEARFGYGGINIRNYGACLCVRRQDLLRVGGADEHETYDGFICGIYELGWRLVNAGLRELWHKTEYLQHVYHPWIKPELDLLGPHKNFISTTSLKNKEEGLVFPLVENPRIKALRLGPKGLSRPGPVRLGVVVPCLHPHLLDRLCDSVGRAFSGAYQVLAVGPQAPQLERDDLRHLPCSEPPAACLGQGLRAASGEALCWAPEDAIFLPGSLDAALAALPAQGALGLRCRQTPDSGRNWAPVAEAVDGVPQGPAGLLSRPLLPLLDGPWPERETPWAALCVRLAEAGSPVGLHAPLCADLWGHELTLLPGEGQESDAGLTRPYALYPKDMAERLVKGMSLATGDEAVLTPLAAEVAERIPSGLVHYLRHKRRTAALVLEFGKRLLSLGHLPEGIAVLTALADELLALTGEEGSLEADRECLASAHCALAEPALEGRDLHAAMRHVSLALLACPAHAAALKLQKRVRRPEFVIDA